MKENTLEDLTPKYHQKVDKQKRTGKIFLFLIISKNFAGIFLFLPNVIPTDVARNFVSATPYFVLIKSK